MSFLQQPEDKQTEKVLKSLYHVTITISALGSSDFVNHSHDYKPNWTPFSPICNSYHSTVLEL